MKNTFEHSELEEMKQQISLLREKLNQQDIVTEVHIRKSFKKGMSKLRQYAMIEIFLGLWALGLFHLIVFPVACSSYFKWVSTVILLFCIVMTWVYNRNLSKLTFSGDLLYEMYELSSLRKKYDDWLKYSLPLGAVWLVWAGYEFYTFLPPMGIGVMVGGLVGGMIGFKMNRNYIKNIDNMLEDISELKKMK